MTGLKHIPVTIVTGFLGSGKTTLLNHLLAQPALAGAAVIVNELGEIGIDHLLVATPAENMVLLDTGCLCCTIRGDLVQTLADLRDKRASGAIPPFSHVVIETTGLADPVPLIQTVVGDPDLADAYRLHDVVTTVDAVNGEAQLDDQRESVKQAAVADALLVTKTDLASREQVAALRSRLETLNPGAEIQEVVNGRIDPALVLRGNLYDPAAKSGEVERWLKVDRFRLFTPRHANDIRSFALYHEHPITRAGLAMWLDMLAGLKGAKLLRMKGLLDVEGEPVVVHAVQTIVHEPVTLDAWPGDDRRSRMVFITRGIERAEIEATFSALGYAPRRREIDPAAYAQFVEAMRGFRS